MSGTPGLRYVKGHGTANDFVLLPDVDNELDLTPGLVRALCDRRRGLGADGVLRVVRTDLMPGVGADDPDARWFMDYRNADGSEAEMCGNGIRVFARYLIEAGFAQPGLVRVATRDGVRTVELGPHGDVTVDMGTAQVGATDACTVVADGHEWTGTQVSVGNPHVVVMVDDPSDAGELREQPRVQPGEAFPTGANVEFVAVPEPRRLVVRVHERGVGETFSCGTGACAAVAAAHERFTGGPGSTYAVDLPGGRLTVTVCSDGRLKMTGPAVLVAQGVLREEWLAEVASDDLR